MEALFTALTRAVEGTPLLAGSAALAWGVLSIVLSPCHLASIPLIVGFIDEQGRISTRRAFLIALLFSVGILVTIGLVGVVTAAAGRMMGDVGTVRKLLRGRRLLRGGAAPAGRHSHAVLRAGTGEHEAQGAVAAFILGLVFGIALGPCTFAYMAPMLAVTFRLAATNLPYGILLLVLYGVGHCSVIVLAGTFTEVVQRYLNWNEKSKGADRLKKVCGVAGDAGRPVHALYGLMRLTLTSRERSAPYISLYCEMTFPS